jgi:recombination associated protein RdgC
MPALRGSLTYARFFVEGGAAALPDDHRERFMRSIRLRAMRPLEPDDEELERSGWSKIGEPHEIELTYDDVFFNEYVNLTFRTDRWVIPTPLLKSKLKEAEANYLDKKSREGRQRLSRREKNELKLLVQKKLRKTMDPSTRAIDFSWSLNEGIVRFFSHAEKPAATMMELFKKTFSGMTLIPESPYTLAAQLKLSKSEEAAWKDLEMTYLASTPKRSTTLESSDDDLDFAAEAEE